MPHGSFAAGRRAPTPCGSQDRGAWPGESSRVHPSFPIFVLAALALTVLAHGAAGGPAEGDRLLPGFRRSPWFDEQVREERLPSGVRMVFNAPAAPDPTRPTRLLIYATPNGNPIEQTLGCAPGPGVDWHFDIQHVAAQVRALRALDSRENLVLLVTEAPGLSWPAWRQAHADSPAQVRALVDAAAARLGSGVRLTLAGHSGGGSFLFGFLNAGDRLPANVDRIVFLDANYSYSDAEGHGEKLRAWLAGSPRRRLMVIAYDDRNITLNGKPVVGPDGGTFRATGRMRASWEQSGPLAARKAGEFDTWSDARDQLLLAVHPNPANRILHTALVGEMNGLLHGLTWGDPDAPRWGTFGGPRAYTRWIQPAPGGEPAAGGIPSRPAEASGGAAFMERIAPLPPAEREVAIAEEFLRGNLPTFLQRFKTVTIEGNDRNSVRHRLSLEAMPDYLAVGDDTDWVRVPMTPQTAQRIADAFDCVLPTRKLVNDLWATAEVKLEPRPLTEAREAVATFVQHHRIIEGQRAGQPLGRLVAGTKKDVVITNALLAQPGRVAIYGWHYPDGKPIQPLTTVHRQTYVDYSHGVRLLRDRVLLDGQPRNLRDLLQNPELSPLVSDEGPLERVSY